MPEVIPAIIPESFADLEEKVARVASFAPWVQIDVCDGRFVPAKSWPYNSFPDPDFESILKEEGGLPDWQEVGYEADLMVSQPEKEAFRWVEAGASRVILHYESDTMIQGVIAHLRERFGNPKESMMTVEIGLAVGQETELSLIEPIIPLVDFVQVMGIAHIGRQGEALDTRTYERLRALRVAHPGLILSVDGGVSEENAKQLVESGANRLVSGSYIFENESPKTAIDWLKGLST